MSVFNLHLILPAVTFSLSMDCRGGFAGGNIPLKLGTSGKKRKKTMLFISNYVNNIININYQLEFNMKLFQTISDFNLHLLEEAVPFCVSLVTRGGFAGGNFSFKLETLKKKTNYL